MVIWTDNAISHITDFIDDSKYNMEENSKSYMRKLIDYADILDTMPDLGKKVDNNIFMYQINQLIYKKHKIIYHKKENDIVILAVLHTRLDINKALRKLKRDIS